MDVALDTGCLDLTENGCAVECIQLARCRLPMAPLSVVDVDNKPSRGVGLRFHAPPAVWRARRVRCGEEELPVEGARRNPGSDVGRTLSLSLCAHGV